MIEPKDCRICGKQTNFVYEIKEKDISTRWYHCPCGVIFQGVFIANHKLADLSKTEEHQKHPVNVYGQLIEELTYGRQMLQVNYETAPEVMKAFNDRGWVCWGIDEKARTPGKNLYKGEFMTYEFTPEIKDEEIAKELKGNKRKFDLIWAQYSLERQYSPINFLEKARSLLEVTGVLFITTPEIDYITNQGIAGWPHWQRKDNHVLWSERALKREVERAGFKVILSRQNASVRFLGHFDIHMIAQR
jgi:hypothetical protein